jgi:hypothetical protein
VPERDAWHDAVHSPHGVIPPALRNEGSEASALSSSGPAQSVGADAQSRNLSSADHAEQSQNRRQDAGATNTNAAAQAAAQSATSPETQVAFLHSANAAAVEGVIGAIELQVERLGPKASRKTRAPESSVKSTASSTRRYARIRNSPPNSATPSAPAHSTTHTIAPSSRCSPDAPAGLCQPSRNAS